MEIHVSKNQLTAGGSKMSIGKDIVMGLMAVICFSLVACSHNNPLLKQGEDAKPVANYLYDAANFAAMDLGKSHNRGHWYASCMNQDKDIKDCDKLYKSMLAYTKKNPQYPGLNESDLSDHALWLWVKSDYSAAQYLDMD